MTIKARCPQRHLYKLSKKGFGNKSLLFCPICKYWIHLDEYKLQKEYNDKERNSNSSK